MTERASEKTRRSSGTKRVPWVFVAFVVSTVLVVACAGGRGEGIDAATLPEDVRPEYQLFSVRCSKCHSLARPLQSGITDDAYWAIYVERMRRQPSSGISPSDVPPILAFLHYFSKEQLARRSGS
ncbi:MAG TPA: hypothetical protein VH142_17455 [Polyangiaceae bacterium]|jgi:hypothetical protein|nr:hypothetical protein [Polyangiaceae bacterium]